MTENITTYIRNKPYSSWDMDFRLSVDYGYGHRCEHQVCKYLTTWYFLFNSRYFEKSAFALCGVPSGYDLNFHPYSDISILNWTWVQTNTNNEKVDAHIKISVTTW